jgi:hypothetical protein
MCKCMYICMSSQCPLPAHCEVVQQKDQADQGDQRDSPDGEVYGVIGRILVVFFLLVYLVCACVCESVCVCVCVLVCAC